MPFGGLLTLPIAGATVNFLFADCGCTCHEQVVDLHGRLDLVRCMGCGTKIPRQQFQEALEHANGAWLALDAADAPDGDADLEAEDFSSFVVPCCAACGGILKPDVVFFGENVPRDVVVAAHDRLEQADAMLIVGSSLMVYSGFRFVRTAAQGRIPIAAINLGRTRADDLLTLKVEDRCEAALGSSGLRVQNTPRRLTWWSCQQRLRGNRERNRTHSDDC